MELGRLMEPRKKIPHANPDLPSKCSNARIVGDSLCDRRSSVTIHVTHLSRSVVRMPSRNSAVASKGTADDLRLRSGHCCESSRVEDDLSQLDHVVRESHLFQGALIDQNDPASSCISMLRKPHDPVKEAMA